MKRKHYLQFVTVFLAVVAVVHASASELPEGGCADNLLNNREMSRALLGEQWEDVLKVFEEVECSLNGSAALLHGHAALALGHNNAATAVFVLVQDTTKLEEWATWTDDFQRKHPNAAVGHYLRGDALARLGRFEEAVGEFDRALKRDASFYLARNSRGVLKSIMYQATEDPEKNQALFEAAVRDFDELNRSRPDFADAYVNRAVAYIEGNRLKGAKKYFDKAIQADPTCALAYNGRAIMYLEERNLERARKDIVTADSLLPSFPHILWNAKSLAEENDTTSAIGKIAWIKGKDTELDTTRGMQNITNWNAVSDYMTTNFDIMGNAIGIENVGTRFRNNWRDLLSRTAFNDNLRGGVYIGVQVTTGTHLVGTTYALGYPRLEGGGS